MKPLLAKMVLMTPPVPSNPSWVPWWPPTWEVASRLWSGRSEIGRTTLS